MKRLRVLIIDNSHDVTGAFVSIIRSCTSLSGKIEFEVLLPSASACAARVVTAGLVVHQLPMMELRRKVWTAIMYMPMLMINTRRLARLVANRHIDLIVSNDFYNMLPPMYHAAGGRIPYLTYVRFRPSHFPRWLTALWLRAHHNRSRLLVAVSRVVQRELGDARNVKVIHNEVPDVDVAYSPPVSNVILYPANYIRGKGQDLALKAFAKVHAEFPAWKLRFVGGTLGFKKNEKFKSELMSNAAAWGLVEQTEWQSFSDNMPAEYRASAFVLNFSASESFSLTCLESIYFGRAVIATRSGGPEEILDQMETGLFADNEDEICEAMKLLMSSPDLLAKLSRNAYIAARAKFNSASLMTELEAAYQQAAARI
jgi:L-malate glycosyltransferase